MLLPGTTVLTLNYYSQLNPLPDRHLQDRVFIQAHEAVLVGISSFPGICQFPVRDPILLTESAGMVLPVSLSSVSSFSWLLKVLPSHTGVLAGSSLTKEVGIMSAKRNLQRLPKLIWKIKVLFFKNMILRNLPKNLTAQEAAARQSEEFQIPNESAVLWSAWHHSHSACYKSE